MVLTEEIRILDDACRCLRDREGPEAVDRARQSLRLLHSMADALTRLVARGCEPGHLSYCFFCEFGSGYLEEHSADCPFVSAKLLVDSLTASPTHQTSD